MGRSCYSDKPLGKKTILFPKQGTMTLSVFRVQLTSPIELTFPSAVASSIVTTVSAVDIASRADNTVLSTGCGA